MRTYHIAVAAVVAAAGVAGGWFPTRAVAADATIPGVKLKMSDATQPGGARRRIVSTARDTGIAVPAAGSAGDPSINGGLLEVANTNGSGESTAITLPAGNWIPLGGDPVTGWRYKEVVADPPTADYKIKVTLKQGYSSSVLRVAVKDDRGTVILYTLDEPTQGSIGVSLATGDDRNCLDFGGIVVVDESADLGDGVYRGKFVAKAAPAPAACASPSGAFLD